MSIISNVSYEIDEAEEELIMLVGERYDENHS